MKKAERARKAKMLKKFIKKGVYTVESIAGFINANPWARAALKGWKFVHPDSYALIAEPLQKACALIDK